jgi:hypothetical protein
MSTKLNLVDEVKKAVSKRPLETQGGAFEKWVLEYYKVAVSCINPVDEYYKVESLNRFGSYFGRRPPKRMMYPRTLWR